MRLGGAVAQQTLAADAPLKGDVGPLRDYV